MAAAIAQVQAAMCQATPGMVCGIVAPAGGGGGGAGAGPAGGGGAAAAAVIVVDPAVVARSAVASINIPEPQVFVGPDPADNEWNMTAVGYPLWLWTEGAETYGTTVTEQGITLTLDAQRTSTTFDMGDGESVTCGATTAWHPGIEPGQPSPTCGHTYEIPSLPAGNYTVTVTTNWQVTWTGLGQTGVIPLSRTGAGVEIPVGELHSLRIR